VVLDNLSSHKVAGVEKAIIAIGAAVLYPPPDSPELNPIEKYFPDLGRCCAKPPNDPWTNSGKKSENCWTA